MDHWWYWFFSAPGFVFVLWLKARPGRTGSNAELWGAPSDEDLIDAGLPPKDSLSDRARKPRRQFGPFPEDRR